MTAANAQDDTWPRIVERVLEHGHRPSDLRVLLALAARIDVDGVDELLDGEHVLRAATGHTIWTVMSAVRWLCDLGVLERLGGTGPGPDQRHRLRFAIPGPIAPDPPPLHEDRW